MIKLLGSIFPATWVAGLVHVMVNLEDLDSDPEEINWNDAPTFHQDGKPLQVCVKVGTRFYYARTPAELQEIGRRIIWKRANPNAARLERMQDEYVTLTEIYAEGVRQVQRRELLELQFSYNDENRSWQAVLYEKDGCKCVYVLPRHLKCIAERLYLCRKMKTLISHPGTAERSGFELIMVQIVREHLNPDAEIKRLKDEIIRGNP